MQSQALAEQIMGVYKTLELGEIDSLRELYSDSVVFEDPAHRVEGLENLLDYFKSMYANVNECEFDFETVVVRQRRVVIGKHVALVHDLEIERSVGLQLIEPCSLAAGEQ